MITKRIPSHENGHAQLALRFCDTWLGSKMGCLGYTTSQAPVCGRLASGIDRKTLLPARQLPFMFLAENRDTLYSNGRRTSMAPTSTARRSYLPHNSPQSGEYRRPHSPASLDLSENEKPSFDFTQRIERKLAEYNASNNVFKRWLFEMSSWLISACSMIAIVLIYLHIKDKPLLFTNSAFIVGINVLGKIASAGLIVPTTEALGQLKWTWFHNSRAMWDFEIFDKASRGPLGALMLLYRTKGRSLAALGALLILLLLGIDSFFQQVSNMSDRWALMITAGELPRTIWYTSDSGTILREGAEVTSTNRDMDLVIDKFSYGPGIPSVTFGNSTRPAIPVVSHQMQQYESAYL